MHPWLKYLHYQPHITVQSTTRGVEITVLTDRLLIRTYRDEDFEHYIPLYSDEKLLKYFDQGKPLTLGEIQTLVQERGITLSRNGCPFGLFSIFLKENGTFLGHGDLLPVEGLPGVLEVGGIICRHAHNQGIGFESAKSIGIDLTNDLGKRNILVQGTALTRVIATVHPKNYPSKKIIEMMGMTFDKLEDRFDTPRLWYSYEVLR